MPVLPASRHSNSMQSGTVCKFHYRRDLMISAIRIKSVLVSIIGQMSCKILDTGKKSHIVHPEHSLIHKGALLVTYTHCTVKFVPCI